MLKKSSLIVMLILPFLSLAETNLTDLEKRIISAIEACGFQASERKLLEMASKRSGRVSAIATVVLAGTSGAAAAFSFENREEISKKLTEHLNKMKAKIRAFADSIEIEDDNKKSATKQSDSENAVLAEENEE